MKPTENFTLLLTNIPLIEKKICYIFKNKQLLAQSFVHSSFLNECPIPLAANERLEFLGDAVLNLIVSEFLFTHLPDLDEGSLSKQKAHIVSRRNCAVMMEQLDLFEYLLVGKGDAKLLSSSSIIANLFEAIIGAIFLDGGYAAAHSFLMSHFSSLFATQCSTPTVNAKAALQELLAKLQQPPPMYSVEEISGPPHDRFFTVLVTSDAKVLGKATAKTKREAETMAAQLALDSFEG